MIKISSVVLYGDSQPDLDKLIAKGWAHPLGLHDEPLVGSLVHEFGNLRFQAIRHAFHHSTAKWATYTEVYVHYVSDDDVTVLKGHGTPFSLSELFAGMVWLQEEFEK